MSENKAFFIYLSISFIFIAGRTINQLVKTLPNEWENASKRERERDRERGRKRERKRERVCVCVCEREREREKNPLFLRCVL